MTVHSFATSPGERYFEDYVPGHIHELGTVTVSESEIIDFARQFDPQYFHIDPEKARTSRFGRDHRLGLAHDKPGDAGLRGSLPFARCKPGIAGR